MTSKLTKIVATLGPASDSEETIERLIESGVNVFRFNTKHGTSQWHEERIKRVQKIADKMGKNIGILMDLQGPEIRLETYDKLPVRVKSGEIVRFSPSFTQGESSICIPHELIFKALAKGDQILIDDGAVELRVENVSNDLIEAKALDDGEIGHRKGVNLPGVAIDLPSLIQEDLKKLDLASTNRVDFVALSFSRTKKDIELLREEMEKRKFRAMIVAKIESMQALKHLDELIESSDAIMVARGDLGVEVPIEQLAYWQKIIIAKCREANKPVITATQMLQSMTGSPRPTRAEATDVANAVLDGTDAVMLSGETASGKYPVKAVQAMRRIASFNEKTVSISNFRIEPSSQTDIVVNATKELLNQKFVEIKLILVFTSSGKTARSISRLRPHVPIVSVTSDQKVVEELTLSYGVEGHISNLNEGVFKLPNKTTDELIASGRLQKGDTIIVVHGQNYYKEGSTNAVALLEI
ncbi:MAG: Pyruvate kinase [Candidatus Collierbacteria bacterium GW2011_GWC2_43_12]|uniref:Pyruvate kinase n=1 Tax=Candidatus Collierbacteria bacterium GW2011_GWC2_43_12 TaxID=1618390 RepID=A0A0G1DB30_9BACT|nr:MAG: Pyruvate kinase [Candidatus Collierbacteria bacterium GW2011_GWC2_43_12]KKT84145.1 MAG: pyruvate kinase, pyruvate kinase [Microgenomates group bacterium GW2011_GWC1_44_9]